MSEVTRLYPSAETQRNRDSTINFHKIMQMFVRWCMHGLQSRPPSPKRAERKVRRRPFREAGSGQNNGTR